MDIKFKAGTDSISSESENVFTGIGSVRVSASDGELIVIAFLIEENVWRVVLSPAGADAELPDWRSSYTIGEDGEMPEYVLHAPDNAITSLNSHHQYPADVT